MYIYFIFPFIVAMHILIYSLLMYLTNFKF